MIRLVIISLKSFKVTKPFNIFIKLFFLGYARGWCETKTLGALITQLAIDPHPPAQIRVTAVASNMEEFARAFKCKPKDDMVPETRCRVW